MYFIFNYDIKVGYVEKTFNYYCSMLIENKNKIIYQRQDDKLTIYVNVNRDDDNDEDQSTNLKKKKKCKK